MYHNPSVFARVWTDPTKWDSPAYPHDNQVSEELYPKLLWPTSADVQADLINLNLLPQSSPNQGGDGGSTPHDKIFQSASEEGESPTSPGEKPERQYKCTICSTRCTQKRVLMRHYREKHLPGFQCLEHDCDHKWTRSRTYEYRKHLREEHRLGNHKIDKILGPPRRRGKRVIESDPPPHFSPPPIEHDRQSLAEPQQLPLMLPVLAVGKDVHNISSPLVPSVTDNPQPGYAESEITTTRHEDSSGLKYLAVTHAPSGLLSKEDFALLGGYYKTRFPPAHPGDLLLPTSHPTQGCSISPHSPPVGEYHTSPNSRDPLSSPWADAASDKDRHKLLAGASRGFRTLSTGSVTRLDISYV